MSLTLADIWVSDPDNDGSHAVSSPHKTCTDGTHNQPCSYIRHYRVGQRQEGQSVVYFIDWPGQPKVELMRTAQGVTHVPQSRFDRLQELAVRHFNEVATKATGKAGDSQMAGLYGSMAGDRSTGLVSNKGELTIQGETWKGMVRIVLQADGSFSVYMADKAGENGRHVLKGNVDTLEAFDVNGNPFPADLLAVPLEKLHVKNRASKYQAGSARPTHRTSKPKPRTAGATTSSASPAAAATSSPPQPSTTQAAGSTTKFDVSSLKPSDKVELVAVKESDGKVTLGETGKVVKVSPKGMLGASVAVQWDNGHVSTIFVEQGDVIRKVS